jgi:cation:H+ antiporter
MLLQIAVFIAGSLILYWGAEILVKGSSRFALSLGIRPIIVGLTVIAMGTSAPEFMVSLLATIQKNKSIALGNIIGSNIANIGLVVGIASIIKPIRIKINTIRREMPFLILTTIIFYVLSMDGSLNFLDGLSLLALFLFFMYYVIYLASSDRKDEKRLKKEMNEGDDHKRKAVISLILTLAGLALLLAGSHLIVKSAVSIAKAYHISEFVIGVTMVAVGTSLPELAVSSVGAFRGHAELAVGNAVGSNLFNMLFVIGVIALISPIPVEKSMLRFEYLFMLGLTIIFFPMMRTGFVLNRWEGLILILAYGTFIFLLFV